MKQSNSYRHLPLPPYCQLVLAHACSMQLWVLWGWTKRAYAEDVYISRGWAGRRRIAAPSSGMQRGHGRVNLWQLAWHAGIRKCRSASHQQHTCTFECSHAHLPLRIQRAHTWPCKHTSVPASTPKSALHQSPRQYVQAHQSPRAPPPTRRWSASARHWSSSTPTQTGEALHLRHCTCICGTALADPDW